MDNSATDFPVTRRTIDRLDDWVNALASPLLPLGQVPTVDSDRFRWVFNEETERALVIGKAVLIASGIRAAMTLADLGHVTECGTILRTVSDFSLEIFFVSEGCMTGTPTADQKLFIKQYFTPMPIDSEEYAAHEKERYVARTKLLAAHYRTACAMKGGTKPEIVVNLFSHLAYTYDKYVHGAPIASMELYYGDRQRFMVRGVPSHAHRELSKRAVASKLLESLTSHGIIAIGMNMPPILSQIEAATIELRESEELS
jgi:hypothetical protein